MALGDDSGNVFLTWENLAFAMPLISVCAVYAFFKFIPLPIALAILLVLLIAYQIRVQMVAQRNERLEKMDDQAIQDLIQQDEADKSGSSELTPQQKAALKKKRAVQARLAKEQKKKSKGKTTEADEAEDDVDDADLSSFVKKKK
uniref:Uncharacterized protein n=1 Tax=Entomoneis paludosa TaxID=265537 RepID=A0A6U3A6B6_9STRA|mmetsp:Transcript_23373/g.48544  ORF Transcript_23373/g.48544 Transcript_23373/m.48544 type:complete len:145 (+) Transcript_23373:123-557(+)|eukprot:CAMPEP_0172442212 /NCGR_PEP_ID=MMETSP1065-20121228/2684_1 /TAXON_ID=265537 /ORGANISM="Amphiprora paludosa, Strain CCMP125" /LENGTH=144 /DNA_ID=CAMNT_0013191981 /DNA_START=46 /DNA_END=480 /DNA_ORIENTATION=-